MHRLQEEKMEGGERRGRYRVSLKTGMGAAEGGWEMNGGGWGGGAHGL